MRLPRQDHYEIARDAALRRLQEGLGAERLALIGARLAEDGGTIILPSLCWEFRVQASPFAMSVLPGGGEVSMVWQILVLDYLGAREPVPARGFASFADFPDGRGYQPAFEQRVIGRLSRTAGRDRQTFVQAVERLGGAPVGQGPVRCILRFFPLLEFQVVRYEGDEDFPPSCNVLFSDNLLSILTMEDGIVAAERLVSALEGKGPAAARRG